MGYTVPIFHDLREKYPTWIALSTFLTSPEGGGLRIIDSVDASNEVIIRYEKGVSDFSKGHVRWFRSVVWDTTTNLPLCIAPPKASPIETFVANIDSYYYQDYLDGVMVNAYRRTPDAPIVLVTRSSFNAAGTFYSQRPFHELVHEAAGQPGINSFLPSSQTFVSLLLQHPEHRVVEQIHVPRLYQIHTGVVHDDGLVIFEERDLPNSPPQIDGMVAGQTIAQWIAKLAEQRAWEWQGVTLKDGTGNRWRVRSNIYRMVRSLRGNSPRPDMRFAMLNKVHLVDTYLYYYPEDYLVFAECQSRMTFAVKTLYTQYVCHHITKTLKSVGAVWKPHIFAIHGYYLFALRPNKQFVREKDVAAYVLALEWQQQLSLMNHRMV